MYLHRTVSTDKILHFKNTLLLLVVVICNVEVGVNSNYIRDGVQLGNLRLKVNTLLLVIDSIEGRMNSNYIHDGVHHGNPRLKAWSDSVLTMLEP